MKKSIIANLLGSKTTVGSDGDIIYADFTRVDLDGKQSSEEVTFADCFEDVDKKEKIVEVLKKLFTQIDRKGKTDGAKPVFSITQDLLTGHPPNEGNIYGGLRVSCEGVRAFVCKDFDPENDFSISVPREDDLFDLNDTNKAHLIANSDAIKSKNIERILDSYKKISEIIIETSSLIDKLYFFWIRPTTKNRHFNATIYFAVKKQLALWQIVKLARQVEDWSINEAIRERTYHAIRSAGSAIMARNLSHNIGSHVLARMSNEKLLCEKIKDDFQTQSINEIRNRLDTFTVGQLSNIAPHLEQIRQFGDNPANFSQQINQHSVVRRNFSAFVQQRMDFIAQISTEMPQWAMTSDLAADVTAWFLRQQTLLEHIASSENLTTTKFNQTGKASKHIEKDGKTKVGKHIGFVMRYGEKDPATKNRIKYTPLINFLPRI